MTRLRSISIQMKTSATLLITFLFAINLNPIHSASFDEQFVSSEHFVDKTLLLEDFFKDESRVFINTPSGFGKSTNLAMIRKFCQMEFVDNNQTRLIQPTPWNQTNAYELFKPLKIAQREEIISEHLAQHPVIFLDMGLDIEKNTKLPNERDFFINYGAALFYAINDHENLISNLTKGAFENGTIEAQLKENYCTELNLLSGILQSGRGEESFMIMYHDYITHLSKILHQYYNRTVVLLIDNYDYIVHKYLIDSPIRLNIIKRVFEEDVVGLSRNMSHGIGYLMITSVTNIGIHDFELDKYLTTSFFYDDHLYTSQYGLTQQEVNQLLEKHQCDELQKSTIDQYCNGYETKTKYQKIYNTSCVVDYFKSKDSISNINTWIGRQKPSGPSNFIWKLLKEPEYLDVVCKLIKHCSTRHGSHEILSLTNFTKVIDNDFQEPQFASGGNCSAISFLIQQGLLSPIRTRSAFTISNQLAQLQFSTDMQYYYEKVANIDLTLVGSHLYDIFLSLKANTTVKQDLSEYLTKAFNELKPLNVSNFNTSKSVEVTQKFVHQSIIHLGALTNQYLKVIEDYPQPITYEKTVKNADRRCVTCIVHRNIALIVKTSDTSGFKIAEDRAHRFYNYSQPDIDHVWYLIIHTDDQKQVSTHFSKKLIQNVTGSKSNRTKRNQTKLTTLPLTIVTNFSSTNQTQLTALLLTTVTNVSSTNQTKPTTLPLTNTVTNFSSTNQTKLTTLPLTIVTNFSSTNQTKLTTLLLTTLTNFSSTNQTKHTTLPLTTVTNFSSTNQTLKLTTLPLITVTNFGSTNQTKLTTLPLTIVTNFSSTNQTKRTTLPLTTMTNFSSTNQTKPTTLPLTTVTKFSSTNQTKLTTLPLTTVTNFSGTNQTKLSTLPLITVTNFGSTNQTKLTTLPLNTVTNFSSTNQTKPTTLPLTTVTNFSSTNQTKPTTLPLTTVTNFSSTVNGSCQ
ncbi:uncharacterized protein LOC135835069 isoform X1 [Planococcus citri]|uniref:uncharacterized protein LOC135835069 isoform X1 n=1 Tax=Planococcus citri TaxID=170843 RepID=UPI0031F809F0